MADERVTDGRRIAELLASEATARTDGPLSHLEVVDVQSDVTGHDSGEFAYAIALAENGEPTRLIEVFVHTDRARLEFRAGIDPVPDAGAEANLRVRPKAAEPPRVLVFLEDAGAVKRVLAVIRAAIAAVRGEL